MGIVATRTTEIHAALASRGNALLEWPPFRAWIGSRLKPSGKCRLKSHGLRLLKCCSSTGILFMEQLPLIESTPAPLVLEKKRYHDLDALRAFAMLLGIALHANISFMGEEYWPVRDTQSPAWAVPHSISESGERMGMALPEQISPYKFAQLSARIIRFSFSGTFLKWLSIVSREYG